MEARRPGGETVLGDIVRMVEDAQTRQAPVQRLADEVLTTSISQICNDFIRVHCLVRNPVLRLKIVTWNLCLS